VNRREFLKCHAKGALWIAAAGSGWLVPSTTPASGAPQVVMARGAPALATKAALAALGGMGRFVKRGARVVIKPNMSFPRPPDAGTNTHPEVVRELAIMCLEAGAAKVSILDHTLYEPEICLDRSGIREACTDLADVTVKAINEALHYTQVQIPEGRRLSDNLFSRDALEADVLIAVPVAKSHSSTTVSMSLKGMMGLVYHRRGMHLYGLETCLVDLCTVLRPHLVLIDATRVLSTNGPGGPGRVLKKDTILASTDMVAADACAVSVLEFYGRRHLPKEIGHISQAHERGLGKMDVGDLKVVEAGG
jgi:uncharacterized protein (DUF362 family)